MTIPKSITEKDFAKIVYSKRFLLGHKGLMLCAPWPGLWTIRIHPDARHDYGLLVHELEHLEGYRKRPWTYTWLMLFNEDFRYKEELRCYAKQLLANAWEERTRLMHRYAHFISTLYRLDVDYTTALKALNEEVAKQLEEQP